MASSFEALPAQWSICNLRLRKLRLRQPHQTGRMRLRKEQQVSRHKKNGCLPSLEDQPMVPEEEVAMRDYGAETTSGTA